jgi:hypothetical protein
MADQPQWLEPKEAVPLQGDEAFSGAGLSVADFWRWGFSDLRENIVRGILAEYLVAKAVGDPSPLRHAWDNFDVTTPAGVRIEVKSSAYLQSWRQRSLSSIRFAGLTGREYFPETNEQADERTLRADLYIFALHTCREPDQYDVLDLNAWEFYVVPVELIRQAGSRSVSKAFLDRSNIAPVTFEALGEAVNECSPDRTG